MEATVLVYTTWPSVVEAEAAGASLVEQGLVACVNILPGLRAVYRWKGAVERADEVAMILKTRAALGEAVVAAVRARHPYETPAILVLAVAGGAADYLAWIAAETEVSTAK